MFSFADFLKQEVIPALGCTEPGAIALAVARAREEIGNINEIITVEIMTSESIYKNGMTVGVPCAFGEKGNVMAAAISLLCGKSAYGLEVLKDCVKDDVLKAKQIVESGKIKLSFIPNKSGVYVDVKISSKANEVRCVIEKSHSNIVLVAKNGIEIYNNTDTDILNAENVKINISEILCEMPFSKVLKKAFELTEEDVNYIVKGIEMNKAIAEYGLQEDSLSGLNVGRVFVALTEKGVIPDDISFKIRTYVSAASDARMAGAAMPVMSAAGSGNQGLVSILPVAIFGEYIEKARKKFQKLLR